MRDMQQTGGRASACSRGRRDAWPELIGFAWKQDAGASQSLRNSNVPQGEQNGVAELSVADLKKRVARTVLCVVLVLQSTSELCAVVTVGLGCSDPGISVVGMTGGFTAMARRSIKSFPMDQLYPVERHDTESHPSLLQGFFASAM